MSTGGVIGGIFDVLDDIFGISPSGSGNSADISGQLKKTGEVTKANETFLKDNPYLTKFESIMNSILPETDSVYNTAVSRFNGPDKIDPNALLADFMQTARSSMSDAYDPITNAVTMQALRTGTDAGSTLAALAQRRAKDTAQAERDARINALTTGNKINLDWRNSANQDLQTAGGLRSALQRARLGGDTASLGFENNLKNTSLAGQYQGINSAYGGANQIKAASAQASGQSGSGFGDVLGGLIDGIIGFF
jgi:hypothetical protein